MIWSPLRCLVVWFIIIEHRHSNAQNSNSCNQVYNLAFREERMELIDVAQTHICVRCFGGNFGATYSVDSQTLWGGQAFGTYRVLSGERLLIITPADVVRVGTMALVIDCFTFAFGGIGAKIEFYSDKLVAPSLDNSVVVIPIGGTLDETCDTNNNNKLLNVEVTWLGPLGSVVGTNPRLLIPGVSSSDAGTYTCRFRSNQGDTAQDTLTLQVLDPPDALIVPSSQDQTYSVGDIATIECSSAVGGDSRTYRWQHNGMDLPGRSSTTLTLPNVQASQGGTYSCVVTNAAGSASASTLLFIALNIIGQPLDNLTHVGSVASLLCEAEAFPIPTYQWRRVDGLSVRHGILTDSAMLTFSPVLFGDEGAYYCEVTSGATFQRSQNATITVSPLVTIISDIVYNNWENATIECEGQGGPDNMYQWLVDGLDIMKFSPVLVIPEVDISDVGEYTCVVTNAAGNDSASTFLYIAPYFLSQPASVNVSNGSSTSLLCDVEGFPSPAIQWMRADGGLFRDEIIANMSLLNFNSVLFGDEGYYYCLVSSLNRTISSQNATITIPPLASILPIHVQFFGDNATLQCNSSGGPDNTYRWLVNGSNDLDVPSQVLILPDVRASDGGEYTCVVSNTADSDSASTLLLVSPYFTIQPIDTNTKYADSINLTCVAESFPSPEFQWGRNGDQIRDEIVTNTSILVIESVQFEDQGDYYCNVSSVGTTLPSNIATITVSPQTTIVAQFMNQTYNCGQSAVVQCAVEGGPGNTLQWQFNGSNIAVVPVLMITNVQASDGGKYTCVVSNAAGSDSASTFLSVAPYFTTQPMDMPASTGDSVTLVCVAEAFPSPEYQWQRVDGGSIRNAIVTNESMLVIEYVMFDDQGDYYCMASSLNETAHSQNATITVLPITFLSNMSINQTYNFGDSATLECTSEGGPGNTLRWLVNGSDIEGETSEILVIPNANVSDGGEYTCVVTNIAGSSYSSTYLFISPYFIIHPEDRLTSYGNSTTLECQAEAFPSPQYQWLREDGRQIRNAVSTNTSTLLIEFVMFDDHGDYYCIASSNSETEKSQNATVTVAPQVTLNATFINQTYNHGDSATLVCSSEGGPSNIYQWQFNGSNLPGENSPGLQLSMIQVSDGGEYTCVVTNAAGSDDSSTFLYVSPYFITEPSNATVIYGESITLECEAEAFPSPEYQWRIDGMQFRDGILTNLNLLVINFVQFEDQGNYYCIASSHEETTNSRVVTLTASCGEPMPPTNGLLRPYPHTREGATVTYQCDEGYRPSAVFTSTCTALWIPPPHEHNCTFVEACVNLALLQQNVSRQDIGCPGDTVSYNCSVQSNSETVQLTWRVTLPGQMPVNITYDSTFALNTADNLGMSITTTLADFTNDEYIESIIVFTVLRDVTLNGTSVECISEDLDSDMTTVFVNMSVPLSPSGFMIAQNDFTPTNNTITFVWDPPQGAGPEVVVDYYWVFISPRPLSHPIANLVYSSPWEVTVEYNTVYSANITAVNCAGQSETSILQDFDYIDCGIPDAPTNGHLGYFSNTNEGVDITFQCNEGYTPSAVDTATCTFYGSWEPDPANHTCTLVVATVSLNLANNNRASQDIDCPGDTFTYICSITSNSETLHLTWAVTYPDSNPIGITYDIDSLLFIGIPDNLATDVMTSFEEYRDEYIESILTLTMLNVTMNQIMIGCSIADLDSMQEFVNFDTSEPLPPTNCSMSIASEDMPYMTVNFEWDPPQGSGPQYFVDHYEVIISSELSYSSSSDVNSAYMSANLNYNELYEASISSVNCAGKSQSILFDGILLVNCGVPDPPANGSVNYTRTTEGASLTFQCHRLFLPVDILTAVCTREGIWDPLPVEYNCTFHLDEGRTEPIDLTIGAVLAIFLPLLGVLYITAVLGLLLVLYYQKRCLRESMERAIVKRGAML